MLPDIAAAVRQAEQSILAQTAGDEITEAFLAATARTRPGPEQLGTLAEELHASNLYLHLPSAARRFRRAALRACRAHAITHARPIDQQAREWWRHKPKRQPTAQEPKVRIRRHD